jgi:signal transduction histidine kinase
LLQYTQDQQHDQIMVLGNRHLLMEALSHLIHNAYIYGQGLIKINLKITPTHLICSIDDSGVGIPVEYRQHIFDPFVRLEESRSRHLGGVGLGLSITQKNHS